MTDNSPIFVVLGRDAQGKPHAARFAEADAERAAKAAEQIGFRIMRVEEPLLRAVAANLPPGKLYATGRAFVPFVAPAVFDKLAPLIEAGSGASPAATAAPESDAPAKPVETPTASRPRFMPRNWEEIGAGSLVLAYDADTDAWWAAVVYAATGDSFRLTWRDYRQEPPFTRQRNELGLLCPVAP